MGDCTYARSDQNVNQICPGRQFHRDRSNKGKEREHDDSPSQAEQSREKTTCQTDKGQSKPKDIFHSYDFALNSILVIGQASDFIPRQGKGHLPDFRKKIQPTELKILLFNLFRLFMEFKETIFLDGKGNHWVEACSI
jgi:hypothetical protein